MYRNENVKKNKEEDKETRQQYRPGLGTPTPSFVDAEQEHDTRRH